MTQKRKPPLLPEEPGSHKTQPHIPPKRRRLTWMLWLIILLLSITIGGITTVILYEPELFGMGLTGDLTVTHAALSTRIYDVELSAQALNQLEFNVFSTQAALDNRQMLQDQQETQSALDIQATQTGVAIANAQQATRAALDFQGTQIAFNRQATQVELDYQGTQAALSRDATAVALGFATQAPSAQLTASPIPTYTTEPFFTDGFAQGIQSDLWQFGDAADWRVDDGQLIAQRTGAWLLTQVNDLSDYTLQVDLTTLTVPADYFIIVNSIEGLAIRLTHNGNRLTGAGLYRFTLDQLLTDTGLIGRVISPIQAVQVNIGAGNELNIQVVVSGQQVTATVNGETVINAVLPNLPLPGAAGVQLPLNSHLQRIAFNS
ncbi:MAG: hypothetical protein CUN56_08715 [Phototrophicales bacterium]|nr:MAG: hypothetical protein CUN56_08715 [Phototrophicales bacterium]RMG73072.1 MAG: hypothetical protein D6711_11695 [Chloroflexota bacterium]